MKKAITLFFLLLAVMTQAQQNADRAIQNDKLFLSFNFMKVEAANLTSYLEVEEFWSKIHEQRIKKGEIIGWDLWSISPGGQSQGSQFLTVQLYPSFEKMLKGINIEEIVADARVAYPKMTAAQINAMIEKTGQSRELNNEVWGERIVTTNSQFDMPLGTVCHMSLMKQQNDGYEKAEAEVFKPFYQSLVDGGKMGNWAVVRFILPGGSGARATHLTFNMFRDAAQFATNWASELPEMDYKTTQSVMTGVGYRDQVEVKVMRLIKKVR